ncbi:MAG: cell division protein FtsA [Anaerolineae bacterium CG2_30_64_16]|nr:MAG: cell division protein FtsA [Anaerolineae bacterium CG2_30_64_16]
MSELICAIDVGTTKICALIGELDDENNLRIIGVGRVPAAGLRRGVVVNTAEATAVIGQAVAAAEATANQVMEAAFVGIAGSHINAIGSKGVVAVGRNGRSITRDDTLRAQEQARNIALPHNRDIIHTVPRGYTVDDQPGIHDPVGMFGYRLEVDASIITGASSAITNLVSCVQSNGVAIEDLVLEPLASAEAVLTDDERQLGVAVVDIGGGTTDVAIYLESAPWHTVVMEIGGDHFIRDVATGLRMPYGKAEALIKQFGHVLPSHVPSDAEVRSGAFGETPYQVVNRRALAEILNARAAELVELILREFKRSGYDEMLPAGIVLAGGVAQLAGFSELCRDDLQWPVRVGRPAGIASSVMDLSSPEYATGVGLLLWGLRRGAVHRVAEPPASQFFERILKWLKNLLPVSGIS